MIDLINYFNYGGINYPHVYKNNCYVKIDETKHPIKRIILFIENSILMTGRIDSQYIQQILNLPNSCSGRIICAIDIPINIQSINVSELYGENFSNYIRLNQVCFTAINSNINRVSSSNDKICVFLAAKCEEGPLIIP